jgi:hypothetical protein
MRFWDLGWRWPSRRERSQFRPASTEDMSNSSTGNDRNYGLTTFTDSVAVGRYVHMVDSYHIYGSYFKEFEGRFLGALQKRSFDQRTLHYSAMKEMLEEAKPAILEKAGAMGQ